MSGLAAGVAVLLGLGLVSCRKAAPVSLAGDFDPRLGSPLTVRQRPTLGSDQAPVVVIEVSSFQCPHCLEFRNDTFPALKQEFIDTGKIQWVMVNAAPDAETAHEPVFAIAKCLDRQGAYGGLFDLLFNHGDLPAPPLLRALRAHGGYDEAKLNTCLADPAVPREIAADFADYQRLEVTGTPTFFVRKLRTGGKRSQARIVGNLPLEYFQRTFNQMLRLP